MTCDCSDEYGPCEQHCELLVVREGASLRTADELALVRCDDIIDVGDFPEADARRGDLARLWAALELSRTPGSGCAWFCDPDDAEEAHELAARMEDDLPEDVRVYVDDGYRIVRLTGGPLVLS
jgi:hypothetical protein